MQYRRVCTSLMSAMGMFLLIMDGKTAVSGISEGISICIRSVIPSLFPFFILGSLLTGSLIGSSVLFLRPLGKWFKIPEGAESLLLIGFLGGYPVGAQTVAQTYRNGQLSKHAAQRMLAFCNQAGPSFLFGILGSILTPGKACLLWGIQIISAYLVSRCIPASEEHTTIRKQEPIGLSAAVTLGIRTMASICGWVVLFRMCIAFLDRWVLWLLPDDYKIGVIGLLELANGCLSISQITNPSLQLLISSGILGFGGLCVFMQTASVTEDLGLRLYFPGKVLQAAFSMLIAWILIPSDAIIPAVLVPIILLCFFSLRKMEKRSGNQVPIGV